MLKEEQGPPEAVASKDEVEHRVSELFPRNLARLLDTEESASTGVLVQKALQQDATEPLAVAQIDLESMQVTVRIRPSLGTAVPRWDAVNCIHAVTSTSLAIAPPEDSQGYKSGCRGNTYSFSRVFDGNTSQQTYFDFTAAPMVNKMLQARQKNCVMMAYGTSAAGKTHTIEGTKADAGVLPRSLELLFQGIQGLQESISVRVSRYEVYNERIYDLLNEGVPPLEGWRHLELKEDTQGCVFIEGLKEVEITNVETGMDVLRRSSRQRRKATTGLNYSSSRSHSIFTITLCWPAGRLPDERTRMSFVDLAGSERVKNTGNTGERLGESKSINSSLMTLRYCLENLRWNQKNSGSKPRQLPYRESKITHLFRDVLHGWGSILFCVNISPTAADYDATASVLQYAAMATQIGNAARAEAPRRILKAKSPNITKKRAAPVPGLSVPASRPAWVNPVAKSDPSQAAEQVSAEAVAKLRQLAEENEELEDARLELIHQVQTLTQELAQVSERAALAESEIRDSVASEMGELLRDMEASYKDRLAAETLQIEKRLRKQLQGGRQPGDKAPPQPPAVPQPALEASGEQVELLRLEKLLEQEEDKSADLTTRLAAAGAREAELAAELASQEQLHASAVARLQQQAAEGSADFGSRLKAAEEREAELAAELREAEIREQDLAAQVKVATSRIAEIGAEARASSTAAKLASKEAQENLEEALRKLAAAEYSNAQLTEQLEEDEDFMLDRPLDHINTANELELERRSRKAVEDQLAEVTNMYESGTQIEEAEQELSMRCGQLAARVRELEAQNDQLTRQLELAEARQHANAALGETAGQAGGSGGIPGGGTANSQWHVKQEAELGVAGLAGTSQHVPAEGNASLAEECAQVDGKCALEAQLQEHKASIRQLQMNAAAEREMLESQLERAAKEKAALERRLQNAVGCGLREVGEEGGAVQAPTPHFIALARAQQAAVNNTPNWQAGAMKQAVAATSRLQNTATAFSPAIQWMATPEAAQIASGKMALGTSHGASEEEPGADASDRLGADDPCGIVRTSGQAGNAVEGLGIVQPGILAEQTETAQNGDLADGPGINQPGSMAEQTAIEQPGGMPIGTAAERPGRAGAAESCAHRGEGIVQEALEPAELPSTNQDAHAQQAQEAQNPAMGQEQHEAIATIDDGRQGLALSSQPAAAVKSEPVNVEHGEKGPQQSAQGRAGTMDVKAEVVGNNQGNLRVNEGHAAVAAPDQKPKRRGRKAKVPSEQAENRQTSAQDGQEGAGHQAKPRSLKGQRAITEAESLGERNQADAQVPSTAAEAAGKPKAKRRRKLLDPTPLKVRVALGQTSDEEELLESDAGALVVPLSVAPPAKRSKRAPASTRKAASALARVSEAGAEEEEEEAGVAQRTRRRKAS